MGQLLGQDPQRTDNKSKTESMGLYQTQKFLQSEGNDRMKRLTEQEKIFVS